MHINKPKLYIALSLPVILIIVLTLLILFEVTPNRQLKIRDHIRNDTPIKPVLYLETGIGGPGYHTLTCLVDGTECAELPKHRRSYSKTYPEAVLHRSAVDSEPNETYGQLMAYYDTPNGEMFLFDHSRAASQSSARGQYRIVFNGNTATINPSKDEGFFHLLRFDDDFYVFCYDTVSEKTGHFEEVVVYRFTETLALASKNRIKLSDLEMTFNNLVNKSFAVQEGKIYFSVFKDNRYYLAAYDTSTGKIKLDMKKYRPICQIADENKNDIYSAGIKGNLFVLEVLQGGQTVDYIETTFPNSKAVSFGVRECFIYGYEDTLYGSAVTNDEDIVLFSYDILQKDWSNWWEVKSVSDYKIMDYKYVYAKDGLFYDLLPYQMTATIDAPADAAEGTI